ncbi:MAG: hypothetical protein GY950_01115 [bacterium]|nr:hypothetical protein [bacterium]
MIETINNSYDINIFRDFISQSHNTGTTGGTETTEASPGAITDHYRIDGTGKTEGEEGNAENTENAEQTEQENSNRPANSNDAELTEEEKKQVRELKEIDRKVRQHEMAHLAAAGGIAVSGANFQYKRGPDGINYAVGGEVRIDASEENDPEATIDKARRIASSALAPADPSPQDRSVAARARIMEMNARMEMAREKQEEAGETQKQGNEDENENLPQNVKENDGDSIRQSHPGIDAYKQNQNSAGNIIKPGFMLDIAA